MSGGMRPRATLLSDQSDSYRQRKTCPCPVGRQDLGWRAAHRKGQAAAVSERQRLTADQCAHCAGELCVGFGDGLDCDARSGEQLAESPDVDIGVDELPHDLGEVGCPK